MIMLSQTRTGHYSPCSYLPDRMWRFQYFFAKDLNGRELEDFLSRGWRKFGQFYFRPICENCMRCIPLRVLTNELRLSKTQRRVMRRCDGIEVRFIQPEYKTEIFEIYQDHSLCRFGRWSDESEFISSFYIQSCPSLQSEYYLHGRLIAVGFIDVSSEALSSVYFVYRSEYQALRLGTLSVLVEASHAASLGLRYYYLGYYVPECSRMEYKGHFHPHETYDWNTGLWNRENE